LTFYVAQHVSGTPRPSSGAYNWSRSRLIMLLPPRSKVKPEAVNAVVSS
jgi:hypothetical protein